MRTGAVNVGGRQNPVGTTAFERAVALATTTRLGTGGARYRVGGPPGPVETVYPGTFRRAALDAAGAFDESRLGNEDYELNWRLRAAGGTVWFAPELVADCRPRGSFAALACQYCGYGRGKRAVLRRHPRSLGARQLAPPLLLLALAVSALLAAAGGLLAAGWPAPGAEAHGHGLLALAALAPGAWTAALFGVSAATGLGRRAAEAVLMPAVLATIHLARATGFLAGAAWPGAPATDAAAGAGRVRGGGAREGA